MKAIMVLAFVSAATTAAWAQGMGSGPERVLVDPDFGLTFETPAGFTAEMVGQTPEGLVMVTVAAPDLPTYDPGGDLCDVTFHYDPSYGQGDQSWVNSLVDDTGFYENLAQQVPVPGTVVSSEHFDHRGSSAHRFDGQHELGGAFAVAAIPSPEGFVLVACITSDPVMDPAAFASIVEAVTMPGQPRDHLVASGTCDADVTMLNTRLEDADALDAETIAVLDAERDTIAASCDGLHADAMLDEAVADAGYDGSYRSLRYDALAQIGANLLTEEQHDALDGARLQVIATSDEATGDRYVKYMHFIVGLRSLE